MPETNDPSTLDGLAEGMPSVNAYADLPLDELAYKDLDLDASYGEQGGHPQPSTPPEKTS